MGPLAQLKQAFAARFGAEPRVFQAPGRVNVIGEHTDYNDGFVLPFALELITRVAVSPRVDRTVQVYAAQFGETQTFSMDTSPPQPRGWWLDYVEGMARELEGGGVLLPGADLWIEGDIPMGAGLSSSASLELASGLAFLSTVRRSLPRSELARIGQAAEHRYVGTRCGIMDQLVCELGEAGSALLIDCRSLEARTIPVRLGTAVFIVCDTRVKHELASSAYNQRQEECETGLALLRQTYPQARALRDITVDQLDAQWSSLPEMVRRRCRHVVTENARTLEAAGALSAGQLERMGKLMHASHLSLREDYEVSCDELDTAVAAAMGVRGVYGSRMTGGGFGGSTVTLMEAAALKAFVAGVQTAFEEKGWRPPIFRGARPSAGAGEVS